MKRSEAAAKIRDALWGSILREDFEYQILEVIESIGMLPPIEPDRTVYDLDLGVPMWEKESNSEFEKTVRNREHT